MRRQAKETNEGNGTRPRERKEDQFDVLETSSDPFPFGCRYVRVPLTLSCSSGSKRCHLPPESTSTLNLSPPMTEAELTHCFTTAGWIAMKSRTGIYDLSWIHESLWLWWSLTSPLASPRGWHLQVKSAATIGWISRRFRYSCPPQDGDLRTSLHISPASNRTVTFSGLWFKESSRNLKHGSLVKPMWFFWSEIRFVVNTSLGKCNVLFLQYIIRR